MRWNWKKKIMAAGLALTLALPMAAYAAGSGQTTPPGNDQAPQAEGEHFRPPVGALVDRVKDGFRHFFSLSVHREAYYRLLAEKYTPSDLGKWEAAFAEREKLLAQLKELKDNGTLKEEWGAKRDEIRGKIEELRDKVKKGEMTKEEAKKEIRADVEQRKEALAPGLAQHKELHKAFTEAVEKKDEAAIRNLLPQLLTEMEKTNDLLAKKIEGLKSGTAN